MTGPEHYRAAEDLIGELEHFGEHLKPEAAIAVLVKALTHAALAHTAATALLDPEMGYLPEVAAKWHEVAA